MPLPDPTVTVARVTGDGLAVLARVADDVFDGPIDPARAAAWLASPDAVLMVAVSDGVVIGQATGVIHRHADAEPELFVENLGVAPEWHRQRVGTRLVEALAAEARDQGCTGLWVLTEPDNFAARRLYAALGLAEAPVALLSARF